MCHVRYTTPMQSAGKVGALVVVFVILLYGAYALVGGALFGKKTVTYYADFQDAGGVTKGTKVLLAGVEVGEVSDVKLMGPNHARLSLAVEEEIPVPKNSTVVLPASLISLGDNPLEIMAPVPATTERAAPGDVFVGREGSPLEGILPDTGETMKELNATLAATRKLLEDKELQGDVKDLLKTTNATLSQATATLKQFEGVAGQAGGLIGDNRALINKAMNEATLTLSEVRQGTEMVTRILEERKFEAEGLALLKKLNSAGAKTEELLQNMNNFLVDPKVRDPLNQSLANTAEITESGKKIAANAEVVSSKAIELADEAKEIAVEVKSVLQDVRGFFGRGNRGPGIGPIGLNMDLLRESNPDYWRTDITATAAIPGGTAHLGMYDAFEGNKLIAQLGQDAGNGLSYRYGIYAAKPGIGVDYRLADGFRLRGDLFDINDLRFDLRARFELGRGLYGWVGMDRMFDQNNPTIGIGVQK
jgi:phospholipid/cholesterol/gamma-HCH transport system substrate-binding protein